MAVGIAARLYYLTFGFWVLYEIPMGNFNFGPYWLYFRARLPSTVMCARSVKLWNMSLISWRS